MIKKSIFEDDLIAGMQTELRKQASAATPDLVKAGECLHAALEIFESQGMEKQANQIIEIMQRIAQTYKQKPVMEMPSITKIMEAGMSQRDLHEFSKGNPIAKAKLNLVLRRMGLSEHHIAKFLGHQNVMSETDAKEVADPGGTYGKMWDWMKDPTSPIDPANPTSQEKIQQWIKDPSAPVDPNNPQPGETLTFKSQAQKKTPADKHTKGLTPERMIANLKDHGTEFNMADVSQPETFNKDYEKWEQMTRKPKKLTKEDVDPDLAGLLDIESFDIDASDDELMGIEVKDDSLEVFDADVPTSDFEDERD